MKTFKVNRFLGYGFVLLGTTGSVLTITGIAPSNALDKYITIFMLVGITNIFADLRLTQIEKKLEKSNE